uniref:Uncharacterized protein n=1 Tax=Pseudonaja textilis TaxID=8673 RepID=A0A670XXF8_PSETE
MSLDQKNKIKKKIQIIVLKQTPFHGLATQEAGILNKYKLGNIVIKAPSSHPKRLFAFDTHTASTRSLSAPIGVR